ncbi:MAG: tubulin-like doman-containing protein [Paludibacteraceae bacterium]|nr:tubulin-like doman-containing protein [Paludibacteraceae bacterium]
MANEKHIFIGLGGSGCQTVSQIKEKVYANRYPTHTATKSRLEAMNENYRFLFLDTDQRDIDQANNNNRKSFEDGRVPFINPQSDLVNLGQANPQAIYYEATQDQETLINKRILEACSPELAVKIPDQPLSFGAGAFRIKSRIAFAHSLTDFQTKLQSCISALNDVKNLGGESCTIFYWVVGSSNGGTGSGIINDVLYHINQMHKQIVGSGDPQLILTMYMPKIYIDYNATEEKYALNAFAVFSEIQAFKEMSLSPKQNTVMHRMAFLNDYNLVDSKRRYCPFYYLIPIDIQTDKGTSLGSTRVMYRNTAEMLYILHEGAGGQTFRSDIDNYMNDIMERNHEDFLVPMGYVQLHKPTDQFARYFRTRFERDLLKSWLINADDKENQIPETQAEVLYKKLFRELDPSIQGTFARELASKADELIDDTLSPHHIDKKEELPSELKWENLDPEVESILNTIRSASKTPEKRSEYKQRIVSGMWQQAESWIKEHGLVYTINAIDLVRAFTKENYDKHETNLQNAKDNLEELFVNCQKAQKDAEEITISERIGSNNPDIQKYRSEVEAYILSLIQHEINVWAHDLLGDFCNNEKSDEIAKLKSKLLVFKDKASEMNEAAVRYYDRLSTEFGNTALDVTTVYLPMLKEICNGNGWKANNFFSRCYRHIIKADDDAQETADRESITKLILEGIYESKNEKMHDDLVAGQYILTEKFNSKDKKKKGEEIIEDCRFFANPKLEEKKPETILEDFITLAQKVLDRATRENSKIQENWYNKKVSHFFRDLPNEQKDDVRRSLSPALFFNYNTNRIEVTKKEEHLVFVAPDKDLATEMLGYEEGNIRHRFVAGGDVNSALVLKSKYGLAFRDYRIYDNIEMVYNKASFREKFHFHHDFAQFLGDITLENLPDEILPQHKTFAKMLLLKEFEEELNPLFYEDEYDPESFESSMYLTSEDNPSSFEVARPEAFSIHNGALCLRKIDNGRIMFDEISGITFSERFEKFFELYYNHRFGETLNNIMQAILRQHKTALNEVGEPLLDSDGKSIIYDGEKILKKYYIEKQKSLLKKLSTLKQQAATEGDKRLYNIFFNIIRNDYDLVYKFIGK